MKGYFQVLIVEKQSQMVHIYKNMLPWQEYGFQISSVTDNEDKALAYYGEYKYELVLCAIDLKAGNGISLIRQIRHLNPHCHIVVVSANEDYDTVREAFKAGCDDYLLKSRIRYSSLARVLEDVKASLNHNQIAPQDENWTEELNLLGLLRDEQKVDTNAILTILKNQNFSILHMPYYMMYFRMDNVRIFNRSMKEYDKPSWMSEDEFICAFQNKLVLRDEMQIKLKELISCEFQDIPSMRLIFTKKHSGLIMLPIMDINQLKQRSFDLIQHINTQLTYEFSISISSQKEGLESFLCAYDEVLRYHQHKFYDGDSCVQSVSDAKQFYDLDMKELFYHEQMVSLLDVQQYDCVLAIMKDAINYMKEQRIEPKQVRSYFCLVITKIEEMVKGKDITEVYPFEVLRQGIQEAESIMYLDLELEKIVKTLMDWLKDHQVSRYKKQVTQILTFINEHIDQKVTLDMIARTLDLSEMHTSRIFKKETGKSIIEYVNEMKMKKASELLKDESLKIKDVAKMIGIVDQLYFNKVFKKYYFVGPREYRKKL